jgi:large subunit ribosomal protein L18
MANRNRAAVRGAVHRRIRRKVRGTNARPRLAVYRSLNHIYAQVIDDDNGRTIASAATTEKDLVGKTGGNIEAAKRVGQAIAERALAAGIESVVFDRGGYLYHGRVRALTDAARAAGLNKNEVVEAEAADSEEVAAVPEADAGNESAKPKKQKAKSKKETDAKEAGAGEASPKPKAKKEAAPKEDGDGGASAEPKAKKQAASKEASAEEASPEPKPEELKASDDSMDSGAEAG